MVHCLDTIQQQHTAGKLCQPLALIADDLQILALLLRRDILVQQQVGKAADADDGSLELMGKVIYKILAQQLSAGKLLRRFVEGCFELRISVDSYPWAAGCRRTVKSPAASRFIACMMFLIGFINTRRIENHKADGHQNTTGIQNNQRTTDADAAVLDKKAVVSLQYHQHRRNGQIQCNDENRFSTSSIVKFTVRMQSRSFVYKLCHITPSL